MTTLSRWQSLLRRVRDAARAEAGMALISVLFFGAGLMIIAGATMARGNAQLTNTAGYSCWETSLAAAESALNWGAAQIAGDADFHTGTESFDAVFGTADERVSVIAAADAVGADDVLALPDSEAVFLRAEGSDALYGVGYCGDRDSVDRRARVVRATLSTVAGEMGEWTAKFAFLTDGDVSISGNPELGSPEFSGNDASVHANGDASVSGNVKFFNGCVTWSAGGGGVSGNAQIAETCPQHPERATAPEQYIPPVIPRDVWFKSEYDMCPDGAVHAGPAHPSLGSTAGSDPCTGQSLGSAPYRGWSYQGYHSTNGHQWKATGNGTVQTGSYYFVVGSVEVSGNQGSSTTPLPIIIVAEASGACPTNLGGDVEISGNAKLSPYTAPGVLETNQLLIMTGRDFRWTGNQSTVASSMVMAHEQIHISGTKTAVGAFLSEEACHTSGSPVSTNSIVGNVSIVLDEPKQADWVLVTLPENDSYLIVGWVEVL